MEQTTKKQETEELEARAIKIRRLAVDLTPGYRQSHPDSVLEENAQKIIETSQERGYSLTDKQIAALVAGYEGADFSWAREIQSKILGCEGQRVIQYSDPKQFIKWAWQFSGTAPLNEHTLEKAVNSLDLTGKMDFKGVALDTSPRTDPAQAEEYQTIRNYIVLLSENIKTLEQQRSKTREAMDRFMKTGGWSMNPWSYKRAENNYAHYCSEIRKKQGELKEARESLYRLDRPESTE